ncbi:2-alkenal reductase (NADP(+)-dependent) isoform X2 [Rhodamnia argentea]|uniref:2-alkenal reductase (NADP(+)-dependent) isoform X2 n=1 Tax=Rhodamnia argentea TaxID=178133 RepID=A0A8B8Q0V0_9MYRT|nr:2-alkenal reductase (NADP(+)-dependent) isoform X2 [Rhodamnia argentea]
MEQQMENRQVIFKGFIDRAPRETDMELKVGSIGGGLKAPPGSGAFLVKNLCLSCDPYMRGRMRDSRASYIPPFVPGQPIEGSGVSKVIDSDDPDFKPGDLVSGLTGWEEYSLVRKTDQLPNQLRKIEQHDVPLSYHLGLLVFGGPIQSHCTTSFVKFHGKFCETNRIQLNDAANFHGITNSLVYSQHKHLHGSTSLFMVPKNIFCAASGAVGQLVGQLAKLHGCYVVGSAGSRQKVDLLKSQLGFDDAFVYKEEPDLDAALKRYFPQGIDIYFDNVGGDMLDAALLNMCVGGRIAVCGMVSQHSQTDPQGIHNLFNLISKRIRMQGFLQSDYLHLFPLFFNQVLKYYKQGKITYVEDVAQGLEHAPAAFVGLFSGRNVGKQVIHVANP